MKLKIFLLLFSICFFSNSCTILLTESFKKMQDKTKKDSTELINLSHIIASSNPDNIDYEEHFVDISELKNSKTDKDKSSNFSLATETDTSHSKETYSRASSNETKEIASKETSEGNNSLEDFLPPEEDISFNAKISSIDASSFPDSIVINAIVTNNKGYFVSGLAKENYKDYWTSLIDSCKGVAHRIDNFKIEEIKALTSPNFSICYVLDHSPSMGEKRTVILQQATIYSTTKVKENDYLSAVKFTSRPTIEVHPTQSKSLFKEQFKINGMASKKYGSGTDILLALDSALSVLKNVPDDYRRIIILLTDGFSSMFNYKKTIGALRKEKVQVFPIFLYTDTKEISSLDKFSMGYTIRDLEKIAKDTEGRLFYIQKISDFSKVFQYIYKLLTNYYRITYKPQPCNDLHDIKLKLDLNEINENFTLLGQYDKSTFNDFAETGSITLIDIEFEYDKATISPNSRDLINDIASQLKRNTNIKVKICGHTDNLGSDKYNIKLSLERAKAVRNELIKLGVDENRLEVEGYGKSKPIAPNDTEENRKKNRRTEFIIID